MVGGVSNLADEAQAWRRETLRRLFETLEREQEIMHVLQDVSAGPAELAVTIGTEHPSTGEWDASLVTAPFKAGDATLGTIGVVGPTRMDYLSAMASVRAVARRLSELATELDEVADGCGPRSLRDPRRLIADAPRRRHQDAPTARSPASITRT